MKPTLSTPSEAVRRLNPHVFAPEAAQGTQPADPCQDTGNAPKRAKTRRNSQTLPNCRRLLNKTERAAYHWLLDHYRDGSVWGHCVAIPLTDGQWYMPDFVVWRKCMPIFYEVKGRHAGKHIAWSERGIEKFKRARAEHPELTFVMLVRTKEGWKRE